MQVNPSPRNPATVALSEFLAAFRPRAMWYDLIERQRQWQWQWQWWRTWDAAARFARGLWPGAAACYADMFEPLLDLHAGAPRFAIDSIAPDGPRVDVDETIVAPPRFARCAALRAPGRRVRSCCACRWPAMRP